LPRENPPFFSSFSFNTGSDRGICVLVIERCDGVVKAETLVVVVVDIATAVQYITARHDIIFPPSAKIIIV